MNEEIKKDAEAIQKFLLKEHADADTVKGFLMLAIRLYNGECRAEYGMNAIDNVTEAQLYKYIDRAIEDLTPAEAAAYFKR